MSRGMVAIFALCFAAWFAPTKAQPQNDRCAGVPRKGRDGLSLAVLDDGICVIDKSQERKVLVAV
jgi:hypothetical protein